MRVQFLSAGAVHAVTRFMFGFGNYHQPRAASLRGASTGCNRSPLVSRKRLKRWGIFPAAALLSVCAAPLPVNAQFASEDLIGSGDGLVTVDARSGLQWLDVSATQGESVISVAGGFNGYTTTHGFRSATIHEVRFLFEGAGFGPFAAIEGPGSEANSTSALAQGLVNLIGPTAPAPADEVGVVAVRGVTGRERSPSRYQFAWIELNPAPTAGGQADLDGGTNHSGLESQWYGHFLVREPTGGLCGDGVQGPGEECDDGNPTSGDGCDANCDDEFCGDGITNDTDEQCDDGNTLSGDGCSSECNYEFPPPCGAPDGSCGDCNVDPPQEQCDDGNATSGDGCDANCDDEFCGDGITNDTDEQCDDGNTADGDGCDANCDDEVPAGPRCPDLDPCGNGVVDHADEECDDGENYAGDGCDSCCQYEFCGDGITNDTDEQCDDGNTDSGDGCDANCDDEFCGDGITNDTDEQCDDGNLTIADGCDFGCFAEVCGNGRIQAYEACDDGNRNSGDGCNEYCQDEFCGDGLINDSGEECDDGNIVDGDGCTGDCRTEICGDGEVNGSSEECDDGNTDSGDGCDAGCYDEFCGDGIVNDTSEECDDSSGCCSESCTLETQGTPCGDPASKECDQPDTCWPDGTCAANLVAAGTACAGPPSPCHEQDTCDGNGGCVDRGLSAAGSACGNVSASDCDYADTCDVGGNCQSNVQPSGTPCEDGDLCTEDDSCDAGQCRTGAPKDCRDSFVCTIDSCDEATGACLHLAAPQPPGICKSAPFSDLQLIDKPNPIADKLKLKWKRGEAVFSADVGDLNGDVSFEVCVFDYSGGEPVLVTGIPLGIPPSALWERSPSDGDATRWSYKDRDGMAGGVEKITIRLGDEDGRSSLSLKAKGPNLSLSGPVGGDPCKYFEQDPIVAFEMHSTWPLAQSRECWRSEFNVTVRNSCTKFKTNKKVSIK